MLRLANTHAGIDDAVIAALRLLPPGAVQVATVMLLKPETGAVYDPVLALWNTDAASEQVRQTITNVRNSWGNSDGN